MKKNQDISKIKESFDSLDEKAPDMGWENVLKDLEQNSIDALVKNSFSSIKSDPPVSAMTGLFNNLNNPVDNIVKESFNEYSVGAPEELWSRLDTQLETDVIWTKIEQEIKVNSQAWKTVVSAAVITLLVSVLPNFLRDGSKFNNRIFAQSIESQIGFAPKYQTNQLNSLHSKSIKFNNDLLIAETTVDFKSFQDVKPHQNEIVLQEVRKLGIHDIDLIKSQPHAFPQLEINKKITKKKRLSLGLIAGLNRTWVIDNETRSSFEKNSLIESKFSLGSMIGLTAQFEFGKRSFIAANYIVNSTSRNKLAKYNNGVYQFKTSEIKLSQLSILYGRSFAHSSLMNWHLNAKVGPYLGLIRSSQVQEGQTITSFNSDFRRLDFGLNIQIAPVYEVGKFEIETGLNYELGLRNIFAGNGYISSDLNYTNNTDLGIYLSLRYRL